ncbi:MAG: YgiT-type zinc finger protein [Planctomycetota bacterium]
MECLCCKGKMEKGTVPLHVDRNGCHLTIDKVPAWVCSQCGEHLFEEGEVCAVQDLVKIIEEKSNSLQKSA